MQIIDYMTLQQAIANELARADLGTAIPGFIQAAEADFNRSIRTRQMMTSVTGTSVGNVIALPDDLREIQGVYVTFGGVNLPLFGLPPNALPDGANYIGGPPIGYVEQGSNLTLVSGPGDMEYTINYIAKIPALSDSAQQNWLIQREPYLYLYQALSHSAPYIQDDQRVTLWAGLAKGIRDGMKAEDDGARYGSASSIRPPFRTLP